MLSSTPRLNFCYLKIIDILHPHYPPKLTGNILKKKQKKQCFCIHAMNNNKNEDENEKWIT